MSFYFRCGHFGFWWGSNVRVIITEHVSRKQGRDLTTEGLWAWSRNLARMSGCIHISLNCWSVSAPVPPCFRSGTSALNMVSSVDVILSSMLHNSNKLTEPASQSANLPLKLSRTFNISNKRCLLIHQPLILSLPQPSASTTFSNGTFSRSNAIHFHGYLTSTHWRALGRWAPHSERILRPLVVIYVNNNVKMRIFENFVNGNVKIRPSLLHLAQYLNPPIHHFTLHSQQSLHRQQSTHLHLFLHRPCLKRLRQFHSLLHFHTQAFIFQHPWCHLFKAPEARQCFPISIIHLNVGDLLPDHVVGPILDTVDLPAMSGRVQNDMTKGPSPLFGAPEFDVIATLAPAILDSSFLITVSSSIPPHAPFFTFSQETGAILGSWGFSEQEQSWHPDIPSAQDSEPRPGRISVQAAPSNKPLRQPFLWNTALRLRRFMLVLKNLLHLIPSMSNPLTVITTLLHIPLVTEMNSWRMRSSWTASPVMTTTGLSHLGTRSSTKGESSQWTSWNR